MKRILIGCISIASFTFLLPVPTFSQTNGEASAWIQFRGPGRAGVIAEKGILPKWPEKGPELVWKKELGTGFSEVLISGKRIYTTMGYKKDSVSGSEYVAAFDAETGDQIWKTEIDSLYIDPDNWGDGPRSTAVTDNTAVYCLSGYGKLGAYSVEDGKKLWQIDFVKDMGSPVPNWGFSSSPMLTGGLLIAEAGGNESKAFLAIDKSNGKVIWSKGNGEPFYCSPVKVTIKGKEQIIFAKANILYSFDAKGDTIWTYHMPLSHPTAVPVFIEPDKIFVSTVGPVGFFIVKIENDRPQELLNGSEIQNHWSSTCYYKGYLYGFNNAALQCVSVADGSVKWKKRGYGKGSLIVVDDKLIVLSDQGRLILAETNPEQFVEISTFQSLEGKSWTAPSFSDGKIFLRNLTQMACYKIK